MSTTTLTPEIPPIINTLFNKLESQKTLIINCTNFYQTLITQFANFQTSLDFKSQTLDSEFQTLDSTLQNTLNSLKKREESLPELLDSLCSTVESRKSTALSEVSKPIPNESTELSEVLRTMCRRMDPALLMRLLVKKRRETTLLREKMSEAFSECVDSERFVIEAVKEFVAMKKEKKFGLADTRWACSIVVRSMFPPEELKEGSLKKAGFGRVIAKKAVERAEEVLKEWKVVADNEGKDGIGEGTGMEPAESVMFIEVLLGFGLKEKFDEEFYRKLMVEFCSRRDMAKLAVPIFGDKIADLIDELVEKGKEVEAVYFASESGLTERFQPVPLLKSFLQKSKKESADILKNANNSSSATDKANSVEAISTRSLIKCVEDHKLEAHFPVETLRTRLLVLEKVRYDRKKGPTPSHSKRGKRGSGRARPSSSSPPHPVKMQKLYSPHQTLDLIDQVSPGRLSPVSRYLGPITHPSQTTYDTRRDASSYVYGGSYRPASYDYGAAYRGPSYPQ